jgi:hypothetical protein
MILRITIIVAVLLSSISCEQASTTSTNQHYITMETTEQPDTTIAILPYIPVHHWTFTNAKKEASLTTDDMQEIEQLLKKCIDNYNPQQEKEYQKFISKFPGGTLTKNDFVIDLKRYKRQYIAIINDKGEKEVWINCFCHTWDTNWRKELILVDDGGNCYFNLKINLTTKKYYDFSVNGMA